MTSLRRLSPLVHVVLGLVLASQAIHAAAQAAPTPEQLAKYNNTEIMKYGVTVGFALAVQTQLSHRKLGRDANGERIDVRPRTRPAALGYLLLVPGYWASSQANREACSSQWASGDEATATDAAFAVEVKKAKRVLSEIVGHWHRTIPTGVTDPAMAKIIAEAMELAWPPETCNGDAAEIAKCNDRNAVLAADHEEYKSIVLEAAPLARPPVAGGPNFEDLRNQLAERLASRVWTRTKKPKCGWRRFPGFWFGWAFDYDTPNKQSAETRTKDGIAFGIAYSPFAQISLLAGVTRGTLDRPDYGDLPVWAFTAALGGNIDILVTAGKLLLK